MAVKPIFRSTIFALILVIGQAFGGFILSPIFKLFHIPLPAAIVLGQVIVLLIPTIVYFLITKQSVKEVLRLNPIGFFDILIIVGIGIFAQPIAWLLGFAANIFFPNVISDVMLQMGSLPLIVKLVIMAITPAICEEITVRGVILSGYKNVNHVVSAVVTGCIFGILHMNFQQFFYAFALGVLLAYLVHITNSIFASMLCHFTFNTIPTLLTLLIPAQDKVTQTGASDISKFTSYQLIFVLVVLFILALISAVIVGGLVCALVFVNKDRKHIREAKAINCYDFSDNRETSLVLSDQKESVFNWPLAVIVVIFAFIQVLELFFSK